MQHLTFYYSAMKGGKSNALVTIAYNYNENKKDTLLIKSEKDTKGDDYLVSRTGAKKKVDIVLSKKERLLSDKYLDQIISTDCILVDEVQFLSPRQIEDLWMITTELNIPVFCYGLRTNFKGKLFEGSKRLLELADCIEELDTIPLCKCGEKARFNAKREDGEFTLHGQEVSIDGADDNVEYEPLCKKCYLRKVLKPNQKRKILKIN